MLLLQTGEIFFPTTFPSCAVSEKGKKEWRNPPSISSNKKTAIKKNGDFWETAGGSSKAKHTTSYWDYNISLTVQQTVSTEHCCFCPPCKPNPPPTPEPMKKTKNFRSQRYALHFCWRSKPVYLWRQILQLCKHHFTYEGRRAFLHEIWCRRWKRFWRNEKNGL